MNLVDVVQSENRDEWEHRGQEVLASMLAEEAEETTEASDTSDLQEEPVLNVHWC